MPATAWSLPASASDTGLAEHLRQPGPSQRAISDSAVLMPPPPLPAMHTASAGKLANHPYVQMAQSRQPSAPVVASKPAVVPSSAPTSAASMSAATTGPKITTSTFSTGSTRPANYKRMSADFTMPPPAIPAVSTGSAALAGPSRPAITSRVSERRSLFEQQQPAEPVDRQTQPQPQAQMARADPIHKALARADPFALPVTHRRNSDKQELQQMKEDISQSHSASLSTNGRPLPVPPSPTLSSRLPPLPPSPSPTFASRVPQSPSTAQPTSSWPHQSPSTAQPTPSRLPPPSPTMSQAPWARPQTPSSSQAPWARPQSPSFSVPASPRFATSGSVPPSPRPTTPGHRHSASISALPPPSPRTPGHKVSHSLSGLQSLVETPKKPDLPSNPAAWNPSQLAQHLRYSLRSGADGQTLPVPVVEDVVTWILRHRVDGIGFLAGVEGIGGSRPPFLPVLSVVSRKLRRQNRAQRHAALPLPEDMVEEPEQTRVRRLAHAFESASEAEDDLHALRQQLTGNSLEGYGRATPRTREKLAWHPRPRADSITSVGSGMSDSRWELSRTKHAPVPIEQLLQPRLSLESAHADDEMEERSTGIRSPSPESPLISPKLLFQPAAVEDVPPLSPSSIGDITHISNLSALSAGDLFSPPRDSPLREAGSPAKSPGSPLGSKKPPLGLSRTSPSPALKKTKRVSSTKRLPSTFNEDESRKVTVTPKRRVSKKRQVSLAMSPAVERASRAGSPLDVPSPIRDPGPSPLRAVEAVEALLASETQPGLEVELVEAPAELQLEEKEAAKPEEEVGQEEETGTETETAAAAEVTAETGDEIHEDIIEIPRPDLEPPVSFILPATASVPASPSPHQLEREVTMLQDRVRELEQRLASVTPTPADTPIKHSRSAMTDDEMSFEKETFFAPPAERSGAAAADEPATLRVEVTEAASSMTEASVQAIPEISAADASVQVSPSTDEVSTSWEAEFAQSELLSEPSMTANVARVGLTCAAVQTSPLARLVTLEDEDEPTACSLAPTLPSNATTALLDAATATLSATSTITKDSAEQDGARSRSSSTTSSSSISRPLPKGWWHAFLSPDEAIPPMRDVPVLFFMAGMGVGVSFGAVVVRVMLGRKLLHA